MAAEKDDETRVGTAPPPQPKLPPAKARTEDESDETRIANAPPPIAKLPPPVSAAPPSAPTPAPTPTPPPAAKPAAPSVDLEDGEATVILQQRPQAVVRLQRLAPPGRSEIVALDRAAYVLGRSHTCDIELFSPTASRTHARLTNRDGRWYVAPVEDRIVRLNGTVVKGEVQLTHKVRLQLGTDELLFLDDSSPPTAVASLAAPASGNWLGLMIAVAVAAVVAVVLWWLLRS